MVEKNAGVGESGAAGGIGGYGAEGGKRAAGAIDEEQGTDAVFGSDGAAGEDAQRWIVGEGGYGNEANVGLASSEAVGAFGGQHAVDPVALGQLRVAGRVLEVPHEGRGVRKSMAAMRRRADERG